MLLEYEKANQTTPLEAIEYFLKSGTNRYFTISE